MMHEVYVFKHGEPFDFTRKNLMNWAEFQEFLKRQDSDTVVMRYNRTKNQWWKYKK